MDTSAANAAVLAPARRTSLAKKLGAGAFLFFLIKGLAWLLVPLAATLLW